MQTGLRTWLAIGTVVIGNAYASTGEAQGTDNLASQTLEEQSDVDAADASAGHGRTRKKCGHRHASRDSGKIEQIVKDYFVARDHGWLSGDAAKSSAGSGAQMLPDPAVMARELAQERGLVATDVHTGLADGACIDVRGAEATVTLSVGTALVWSAKELGESSLSDSYIVQLEKTGETWTISDVAYAPIPSTDRPRRRYPHRAAGAEAKQLYAPLQLTAAGNFNRQAAADYALRWSRIVVSDDGKLEEEFNPDYDRQDNDCTNFVSQALHAGGWPIHDGWDNENEVNWSPDLYGPYGPSKTWSVAPWLLRYARNDKRGQELRMWPPAEGDDDNMDIWTLQLGDLIFPDWDPDGHFDGTVDHAMIITGSYTELGFTEPVYSQHSPHRQNMPLSVGIKIATSPKPPVDPGDGMGGQGRVVQYHPVHLNDQFTTD